MRDRPLSRWRHSLSGVMLLAVSVGACGAEQARPPAVATPSPSLLAATTATPVPSASSPGTPAASAAPSPATLGGFITPVPVDTATAWATLSWRELAAEDPLAHIRSMTRWGGGFIAVGDTVGTGNTGRTPVWVSPDGAAWNPLGADVFGPSTVIVGVAETADGIAALSLQSAFNTCEDDPEQTSYVDCWSRVGPLQAWTSTDGATWTAHPGPTLSRPVADATLVAGTADHLLAVVVEGQPLATSRDGVAWQSVPSTAFPRTWRSGDVVAVRSGFVAFGNSDAGTLALTSRDGLDWTTHVIERSVVPAEGMVVGSTGVIASGLEDKPIGLAKWIWWSSTSGSAWDVLADYPPLGVWRGKEAQECDGACPDGLLVGDGDRMLAYRGGGKQAGWTSFDGRSWQPLAFEGSQPTSQPVVSGHSMIVLPVGVTLHGVDGSIWFGTPAG